MNFWVNELFGSPFLAIMGIELLYAVIMFLGRMSFVVMGIILSLAFILFAGLLWGSWITVFVLIIALVYFGTSIIKFYASAQ